MARNLGHTVKRLILTDIVDLNSSNGKANEHDQDGQANINRAECSAHEGATNDHEPTTRREREPIFNFDPYELENAMVNVKLNSPDPFK